MVKSSSEVQKKGELSLYFHIPFCTHKCHYCHFYVLPDKETYKDQLLESFKEEWTLRLPEIAGRPIVSVYFGGGTPYLFGPKRLSEILDLVKQESLAPEAEITLEANPENIESHIIQEYAKAGINRVSLGIQSLTSSHLATLTRFHTVQKAIDSIHHIKEAGISNISIDLMYDLPHQTVEEWSETLDKAVKLPITHISLYNLTIEPHTVFYKYRESLKRTLPSDDASTSMYQIAHHKLTEEGFNHYEISAYAKDGMVANHNIGYWIGREFLGFGPSAFSYMDGQRFRNIANLHRYSKLLKAGEFPIDFVDDLDVNERKKELLAVNLRVLEGLDLRKFQNAHGSLEKETQDCLLNLEKEGFIDRTQHLLRLTERGILFYDTVASELI